MVVSLRLLSDSERQKLVVWCFWWEEKCQEGWTNGLGTLVRQLEEFHTQLDVYLHYKTTISRQFRRKILLDFFHTSESLNHKGLNPEYRT